MRNLKRALSLTLASVMLLGMMVVGSSAAGYPDVDDEDNVEAIEVIQAVGIMVGDENGNFGPDNQVTRAQMAVILAKLMDLSGYIPGTNPFPDVTQDWAIPSISACYARGYISGYDNGNFGPNDPVTAVQAASMLMRALGYFQYAEDFEGGFELSTIRQAGKIDLFNGIDNATAKTELTRNQVAQMVLNTLESGTVEADDSNKVNVNVGGTQVSVGATNYVYITSREEYAKAINAAEGASSTATTGMTNYIVDLGEKLYQGDLRLLSDQDEFDRPAYTWEYKTEKIGTYTCEETYFYTKAVSEKDLANRLGTNALDSDRYDWNVYYNGEDVTADAEGAKPDRTKTSDWSKTATGTLTQVYVVPQSGSARGSVTISMIDTMLAEVIRVSDSSFTVSYRTSSQGTSNLKNTARQTQIDVEKSGLAVGDRLLVRLYEDGSRFSVYDYSVAETVTGTVTAVKARYDNGDVEGSYAVMDGNTYNYVGNTFAQDLGETSQENPTISASNTLYLDYYDNMIAFEATERTVNYLYLKDTHEYFGSWQGKVTFADGTSEVVNINEWYNVDANGETVTPKATATPPRGVYAYTQDGSNYKLYALKDCNTVADSWDTAPFYSITNYRGGYDDGATAADGSIVYSIRNKQNSIRKDAQNVITLNSATIFVDVEGGKVYTGYNNVPTMTDIAFYAIYNRQLNADVVFITAGADNSTSDSFFYVKNTKPVTDKGSDTARASVQNIGGTNYYTYDVWMDGKDTTITLKGTNLDAKGDPIKDHTLYRINTMNSDGQVTKCETVEGFSLTATTNVNFAQTAGGGTMRIVEVRNGTSGSVINGAKNNIAYNYPNSDLVERAYTYDSDTIFMMVRIDKDNKKTVDVSDSSAVVSAVLDKNNDRFNNVYVIAVDDKDARSVKATLVYVVEYEGKTGGITYVDGDVSLSKALQDAGNVGAVKSSKVEVDEWGEIRATFTLTKPEWAYVTDAEGASAKISYDLYQDGKAFKHGSDLITAAISSNNGYLTANGTTNDTITEFTGTYRITKDETMFPTSYDKMTNVGHSYSIVITGIEWTNAAVNYVYATGGKVATVPNTTLYVNNDGGDKSGKVGFTLSAAAPANGKYTLSGVKTSDVAESTWKDVAFTGAQGWVAMSFTQVKNSAVTVTITPADGYKTKYPVTILGDSAHYESYIRDVATGLPTDFPTDTYDKLSISADSYAVEEGKAVTFTFTGVNLTGHPLIWAYDVSCKINGKDEGTCLDPKGSGNAVVWNVAVNNVTGPVVVTDLVVKPVMVDLYATAVAVNATDHTIKVTFNKELDSSNIDRANITWDADNSSTAALSETDAVTVSGNVMTFKSNDEIKDNATLIVDAAVFLKDTSTRNKWVKITVSDVSEGTVIFTHKK